MQTKIFLYHQRHCVVLLDTINSSIHSRRYYQVYTRNLIAHKGTDNQILIEFVNQDQKRVDVTGKEFTCRLISHDGETLLLEKPLTMVNETAGQTKLVLTEEELDLIAVSKVGFSVEQTVTDSGLYEPVYVDADAGGRGVINVVDSIMPSFVSSKLLTIPAHIGSPYETSLLQTNATDLHTFQILMDQFVGEILVEGATDTDGNWYTIQTEIIATAAGLHLFSVAGFHQYIRFTITETAGTITEIRFR